jgi:uncharacterized protein (TIGR02646 family)
MKYIIKNVEPNTFTQWKIDKDTVIQGFYTSNDSRGLWSYFKRSGQVKNDIRESLIVEQGYICAYCNREIHNEAVDTTADINWIDTRLIIEHLGAKSVDIQGNTLNYDNFVATCEGGEKIDDTLLGIGNIPIERPYCDKKKLNQYLALHPLMPECETEIIYRMDGSIKGLTDRANEAIELLGLSYFKENRRDKIIRLLFEDDEQVQLISKEDAQKIFDKYNNLENGKYESYCSAICSVIKNIFEL